jgi:tetratricopeptide (TPR) repeat protein
MINFLIAIAVGIVTAVGLRLGGFSWVACVIPGALTLLASYVVLARRTAMKVQAITQAAQKELSVGSPNPREQKSRIEKAIGLLESGLPYSRWQFMIGSELHAQIAMIRYMTGDLEKSEASFAKANPRNYMAQAMMGALAFRKKNYDEMERRFEDAVKYGKKEALVWATYAWCQMQRKEKDKALAILVRGVQINPSDDKLKASLQQLQNDKKLKMRAYEPMWWQFGLEAPSPQMAGPGGRAVRFQRG